MGKLTYTEILEYLQTVPAASTSWAAGFHGAGVTMRVLVAFVETMTSDATSPLREAEDSIMAKEIRMVQMERGMKGVDAGHPGRPSVRISTVLSVVDQTKVRKLVGAFCFPVFQPKATFVNNGHSVANAVRRACSSFLLGKLPQDSSVVEVGPDEKNWLFNSCDKITDMASRGLYRASHPVMVPRDAIRVAWTDIVNTLLGADAGAEAALASGLLQRARMMRDRGSELFERRRVQGISGTCEFIVSMDVNYDVAFADMPRVMRNLGARVWYGYMSRAKGLTRHSRVDGGSLELMGTSFRVDWRKDRIRFSQFESSAFGYEHRVSEYMKYEEHNGYVWDIEGESFVYSKMPETNSELLFFSVVRVPKVSLVAEHRFVENPLAGMVKLVSLWAVGDEVSGVPTSFERVQFHVDALSFYKVLEKRACLGTKGNLANSLAFVRSTRVRFWLNGTPVSSPGRVSSRVAEATAVVVETLCAQGRLQVGQAFDKALGEFKMAVTQDHWFLRVLEDLVSFRAVTGKVMGAIVNSWNLFRTPFLNRAVSDLHEVTVSAEVVGDHVGLGAELLGSLHAYPTVRKVFEGCMCMRLADVRAALGLATGPAERELRLALAELLAEGPCQECERRSRSVIQSYGKEVSVGHEGFAEKDVEVCDGSGDDSLSEDGGSETSGICDSTSSVDNSTSGQGDDISDTDEGSVTPVVEASDNEAELAMTEFIELEEYLLVASLSECRVDATQILPREGDYARAVREASTTRVKHAVVRMESGRAVKIYAASSSQYGALYDLARDRLVRTEYDGMLLRARVDDGWYYTCDRLRVFNSPSLVSAVRCALGGVVPPALRSRYEAVIGVPGAGKTYGMMKALVGCDVLVKGGPLVLSVTKESSKAAVAYGRKFGLPEEFLRTRVMTLDSYLVNNKGSASLLCVDEFTMVHIGKVDAAVTLSGASCVRVYGDGRQIKYDPFTRLFTLRHARLGSSVPESKVTFLPETHRCQEDTCAAFVDEYPAFYPCQCCRVGERELPSLSWERVVTLGDEPVDPAVRYHTYKQEEKTELQGIMGFSAALEDLRAVAEGGLATVGEDQGTTHKHVHTYRTFTTYDRNAKRKGATLFNRVEYVLTDMTRHTVSYKYTTLSEENDEVIRRIKLARDPARIAAVRARTGFGEVSVASLLE